MTSLAFIFVVAVVYASVGHGGASGYLAALSLLGYDPARMASSALILNLWVAGLAFLAFWRAGHFCWARSWPFLVASIPAAIFGGWLPVAQPTYHRLLAAVLCVAAFWLWVRPQESGVIREGPPRPVALSLGAGIGVVSGIVGVGGGIFLSPLLVLCRWAWPKQAAATSALFILLNSLGGLAGRFLAGRWEVGSMLPLLAAAFSGGWIGSHWGAHRASNPWLCRILGIVLAVAAVKWMLHD